MFNDSPRWSGTGVSPCNLRWHASEPSLVCYGTGLRAPEYRTPVAHPYRTIEGDFFSQLREERIYRLL